MTDSTPVNGQAPLLQIEGHVATVTLRRPEVANRLDLDDLRMLLERVRQVNADPQVRVLRLTSVGKHFCSGFNLHEAGSSLEQASRGFEMLADAVEQARPITLAVIRGGAFGGAVDLAMACDFRLGTTACRMFVPAARLGLHFYGGGLRRFQERLGLSTAKRLLLAAETFEAPQLLQLGLLDKLVEPAELEQAGQAWCDQLASMAPLALLPMKRHLNDLARGELDRQRLARDIQLSLNSEDLKAGAEAWAESRQPRFSGR